MQQEKQLPFAFAAAIFFFLVKLDYRLNCLSKFPLDPDWYALIELREARGNVGERVR